MSQWHLSEKMHKDVFFFLENVFIVQTGTVILSILFWPSQIVYIFDMDYLIEENIVNFRVLEE